MKFKVTLNRGTGALNRGTVESLNRADLGSTIQRFNDSTTQPSSGIGDTLAKATQAVGLSRAVKRVSGWLGFPCGCARRREWLNKKFPYKKKK